MKKPSVLSVFCRDTLFVGFKGCYWFSFSCKSMCHVCFFEFWPLKARRSLFLDWLWLCDESSPHRGALHIPVQILAGKFKMEFLPTVSLT